MDATTKTFDCLREAEKALAQFASAMAGERDYSRATAALALADEMKQLVLRAEQLLLGKARDDSPQPPAVVPRASSPADGAATALFRRTARRKPREYPKFFRDGENLVKVGWSKRGKCEYEHKAPRAVLLHLVAKVAKAAERKRRFTMDDILPLKNPADGSDLPEYQVYVCLAWLRHAGLVAQHGRKGYTAFQPADLAAKVEKQWQGITNR